MRSFSTISSALVLQASQNLEQGANLITTTATVQLLCPPLSSAMPFPQRLDRVHPGLSHAVSVVLVLEGYCNELQGSHCACAWQTKEPDLRRKRETKGAARGGGALPALSFLSHLWNCSPSKVSRKPSGFQCPSDFP